MTEPCDAWPPAPDGELSHVVREIAAEARIKYGEGLRQWKARRNAEIDASRKRDDE